MPAKIARPCAAAAIALAALVPGTAPAQDGARPAPGAAYCPDLRRVVVLALTNEFASIAGNPREGHFADTTLALAGWKDCSLYGSRTYTCDSQDVRSAEQAAQMQSALVDEIKTCLGHGWGEDKDRSSPT